ncbi:MAG: peptidoglycan-binding protein [Clostridia bacterium]|nr:peptidoglycan-binding protein [Clostridia bacterium]
MVSNGSEEFAMLHCSLPAMVDPIEEHVHDWAPATCVSPTTCRICGRYTGVLGNHNYQPAADTNVLACIMCGIELSPPVDDVRMLNAGSICPGERSNYVATLQLRLQALGYYNGNITGQYDEETAAAVKTYQTDTGLVPDGICGPDTLALMFN